MHPIYYKVRDGIRCITKRSLLSPGFGETDIGRFPELVSLMLKMNLYLGRGSSPTSRNVALVPSISLSPMVIPEFNLLERVHKEMKRRTKIVGAFTNETSLLFPAVSILIDINEEWIPDNPLFTCQA